MLAHQGAGELPCGWCIQAERTAFLAAEASRPQLPEPVGGFFPVTPEEASINRAILEAEVKTFEQAHRNGYGRRAAA
jgi:hypothetical protein